MRKSSLVCNPSSNHSQAYEIGLKSPIKISIDDSFNGVCIGVSREREREREREKLKRFCLSSII